MDTDKKSFLNTFVPPRPNHAVINVMTGINRLINLYGIPVLRDIPILNRLPVIRGLCDIRHFDIPTDDHMRLQAALNGSNCAFITPNHPEFFTDWMIDKEISARYAPYTASWATHDIVNGMGEIGQKFWLANHLIAQVPGNTDQALAYSVATAQSGTPVLLHPEGRVYWQSDRINTIFPGAAKMALQAAAQGSRPVLIQPLVWKLKFIRDEEKNLHAEMIRLEKQLKLPSMPQACLSARLSRLYKEVLWLRFEKSGFQPPKHLSFFEAQSVFLKQLLESLQSFGTFDGSLEEQAEAMISAIRQAKRNGQNLDQTIIRHSKELEYILRTPRLAYTQQTWQQEYFAECIKRLRNDHLAWGSKLNSLHQFVPRPVGGRTAHIRAAKPLDIRALLAEQDDVNAEWITQLLHRSLQDTLNNLNKELAEQYSNMPRYPNPLTM